MHSLSRFVEGTGDIGPWLMVALFLAASVVTVWRLESMSADGWEGTVLGTLITPYLTGMSNLIFAWLLARKGGPGSEVITNCLVNNVTNMTLILGVPAILWKMTIAPQTRDGAALPAQSAVAAQTNRRSLLLTLAAIFIFTGALWAVGSGGAISFPGGMILIALFLVWQVFHVVEVLKSNARQHKTFGRKLPFDLALLLLCGYAVYFSTDWLVDWISTRRSGFITLVHLGWLSGWLMVLPNGMLALYYGWTHRPEIVYSSQVGDSHICIPLCVGIYALFHPMTLPPFFQPAVLILLGSAVLHFCFVAVKGQLPRYAGVWLLAAYGYFLYTGLSK